MLSEKWIEFIEEIQETQKKHVILKIYSDIVYSNSHQDFIFKDYNYWCILGFMEDNEIEEILNNYDFRYNKEVQVDGEYESTIIVRKYYDYGETYEIVEDQFDLIKTIQQRNREEKVDNILIDLTWDF